MDQNIEKKTFWHSNDLPAKFPPKSTLSPNICTKQKKCSNYNILDDKHDIIVQEIK